MGGTKKAGILADCPGEVRVAPIIATVNVSGKMQAHILNRIFPWSGGYGTGELRIIGGDWRSRKLRFPDAGGVRPTPARTRETLFNWLAFHLAGSDCLDLFAGSGALGLEALSRGAGQATLVDHTPALAKALRDNLRLLKSDNGEVVCSDVESYLAQ